MPYFQLWTAVGLIWLESIAFAYFTEAWTVPVLVSVLAMVSLITDWRVPLNSTHRFVASLMLAVPFTLQWAVAPYEPQHIRVFILYTLAFSGGQYGLALQTGYIWVKPSKEPWSSAFPVCGVCVLLATGDLQTTAWQNAVFQSIVLAFVLLIVAYFSFARATVKQFKSQHSPGRLALSLVTLLLTFSIAVIASRWLEKSWSTLEKLYTEWMYKDSSVGGTGFSRQAKLGSLGSQPSPEDQFTALRVKSHEEPGYLRGAAYERYSDGSWTNGSTRRTMEPVTEKQTGLVIPSDMFLYRLPGTRSSQRQSTPTVWHSFEVWPTGTAVGSVFARLEARWIAVNQTQLEQDQHGICYVDDVVPDTSHFSFVPIPASVSNADAPANSTRDTGSPFLTNGLTHLSERSLAPNLGALLELPSVLDPKVRHLAEVIFAEASTAEQKLDAVTNWFRKNYHYQLGIKIPSGEDPLTYFLTRAPAAHCEYFAAGTVLTLRLAGIPCRYVTGFVVTEYNYLGGYWMARNKDAHAWAEAWVPGRGWVIVESTPTAGIPRSSSGIQPRHLWDDLLMRVQMIRSLFGKGTWISAWRAVRVIGSMLFQTPHGWLLLLILMVWCTIRFRWIFQFSLRRDRDPVAVEFHRLLSDLERQLNRFRFVRVPNESLHQFAERVECHGKTCCKAAADWLRDYAMLRYRGREVTAGLQELHQKLRKVTIDLKHPRPETH